ncbi:MAG TPA: toprim domain-containing protein [Streptosporangiaceae bacterium]|nr:toprim domain-containing protein [Streptosporangiaceae bacterium]
MWASAGGGECDELSWDRLAAATAAAASFFSAQLGARPGWAPGYLASRGLWPRIWRQWGIGYAPSGWTALTSYLRGLGFPDDTTVAAGLARRTARGTLIDVFRDRVMFPVRTLDAIVAGFIGRAPPGPSPPSSRSQSRKDTPVYLNTGLTPLYHKGELLFGLYEAQHALRAGAVPVLVEGPFDAIAVTASAGGRFAGLAPCGTALTAAQVSTLADAADLDATGVLVAFDGDRAGRMAAVRAFPLLAAAASAAGAVTTVTLADGQDPAGYLRDHGPGRLAEFLAGQQQPLADLVVDARIDEFSRWLQYPEGIYNALRAAAAAIAQLPPQDVARQVIRAARRLGVRHQEVTSALIGAIEP